MTPKKTLRGQVSLIAVGLVVVIGLVCAAAVMLRGGDSQLDHNGLSDTFVVRHGSFDITLPVTGELAALKQIEIRNSLDSRAIITEIVPEGTFVQAGDVVLRLNDEDVRNRLRDAQDKVNVAEAALVAAQSKLDIQIKTREADLAKADLAIKLADLALKAWQEGEAVTKLQELELAVTTAEKEFTRLDERFQQSGELVKKDFISKDEFKRDEIAMMKAESDLKKARNDLMVYQKYQFEQDRAKKVSDLDQARSERLRVEQQADAEVRSAKSDVDSKQYQLDSAKEKLTELETQLSYCTVTAPAPGLVVYYSSTQNGMGRNDGRPPQVGTELTRNEMVIILPDTSKMVAAVKVSEALVGQIQPGQHATIICDAMPDRVISGQVQSVGVLAESGGWRDPNRRDYTVRLLLTEGTELGLKPSMRCKANIYVGRIFDALHVPVQAIFRNGPLAYVYVPQNGGYAQRKVTPGRSSELYIEITEGLKEGEIVLLRQPQPEEIVSRLPVPKGAEQNAEKTAATDQGSAMMQNGGPPGANDGGNPNAGNRPEGGRRRGGMGGAGGNGGPNGRRGNGGERPAGNGDSTPAATTTTPDKK